LDLRWVEIATKQLLVKSFQLDPVNDVDRIDDVALPLFVSMLPEQYGEFAISGNRREYIKTPVSS
jgi:hypothetical protein